MARVTDQPAAELAAELRRAGVAELDTSPRRRAEYSSDASNYRVVPQAVVFPRTSTRSPPALAVGRATGVPVTSRGGGTSTAGNAVGPASCSTSPGTCDRVLERRPGGAHRDGRAGRDPGRHHARPRRGTGCGSGPDPSTHARATHRRL